MTLTPEIMLLGDRTMSRLAWTLRHETERIEALAADSPDFTRVMAESGWTPRAIAWGHILAGFLDALDFDDEKGRA